MTSKPVGRTTSRITHAVRNATAADAPPPRRPPSLERLAQLERGDDQSCAGLILVALRIAPHVTTEGPEDLAERVRGELHGRWLRVFGSPHQMFAVDAWPVLEGGQAPPDPAE